MAEKQLNDQVTFERRNTGDDHRIEQILDGLLRLAGKDFNVHLQSSEHRDEIDAIMLSVNMLSEEMNSYTEQLEKSREQIAQNAKLASLGEMASGLSHELNNPLFLLMGFNELVGALLKENFPEAYNAVQEHLAEVDGAGQRIGKIINHMRDFSRQSKNDLELVDINEVIQSSFVLLNQQLKLKQIFIDFDLASTSIPVMVDKIKMEQVFVNLISNARDAIEQKSSAKGGNITVKSSQQNGFALIEFSDDGSGMDEETKSKVFDAFFTTKGVGKGTGLGMSVSLGILQSFHAVIECDSSPMEGTTFTIKIPVNEQQRVG